MERLSEIGLTILIVLQIPGYLYFISKREKEKLNSIWLRLEERKKKDG